MFIVWYPIEFSRLHNLHPWYWNSLLYGLISSGENSAHFLQLLPFTILHSSFHQVPITAGWTEGMHEAMLTISQDVCREAMNSRWKQKEMASAANFWEYLRGFYLDQMPCSPWGQIGSRSLRTPPRETSISGMDGEVGSIGDGMLTGSSIDLFCLWS